MSEYNESYAKERKEEPSMPFEYKRVSDTTSNASDQATRSDSATEKRRRRLDPYNNEGYASPMYDQIKRIAERYDHDLLRRDHSKTAEGYEGQLQERTRSGRDYYGKDLFEAHGPYGQQPMASSTFYYYDANQQVYYSRPTTPIADSRQQSDRPQRYDKNYAEMTQEELGAELAEKVSERHGYCDQDIKNKTDVRAYLLNECKLNEDGFKAAKSKLQEIVRDPKIRKGLVYAVKVNYTD